MKLKIVLALFIAALAVFGVGRVLKVSAQDSELTKTTETNELRPEDTPLLTEDFTYPVGQLLTANGWTAHSGAGTNSIAVTSPGLTFTGYPGSGIGNAVTMAANGEDVNRGFATQSTGTVYASALVNVTSATATGDYFFHLFQTATIFHGRVFVKSDTGGIAFGISKSSTSQITYSAPTFATGTTYLLVVKYKFNGGSTTDDDVALFVNPVLNGTEPTPTVVYSDTGSTDSTGIVGVALRQGGAASGSTQVVDGIRVGNTWASVTQPATAAATPPKLFKAVMRGSSEVPANNSTGIGFGRVSLNAAEDTITASFYWRNLTSPSTIGHIHGAAIVGVNAPILFDMQPAAGLTSGSVVDRTFAVTPAQVADLKAGLWYFNVHSQAFPGGEIRGQILASPTNADFNGDNKTDLGVVRTEGIDLTWYLNNLATGTASDTRIQKFGFIGDAPQAADYDGDGKTDIAVWRPGAPNVGAFLIFQSSTNTTRTELFGVTGDDPTVAGDYDGDGKADVAVYRPGVTGSAQGFFFYRPSTVGGTAVSYNPWGTIGDVPVPGDFDGDGRADFVVKRNVGGQAQFWRRMASGTVDIQNFGLATDTVVPGDYDADGRTDLAVARAEGVQLVWYYRPSATPATSYIVLGAWGVAGDQLVQGDYDGDGRTDQAIFRPNPDPNQNFFWINRSTSGFLVSEWGANGDKAVASYNSH